MNSGKSSSHNFGLCWARHMGEYREAICKKPEGHEDRHGGYEPTEGMSSRWWEWDRYMEAENAAIDAEVDRMAEEVDA